MMHNNNNPRRRHSNSGGGQHHRPRHNNNGGGNNKRFSHSGPPRPRKNYKVLLDKYLNMARDAMASGDRILAEYYFQHADHYFRMQQEFMEERNRWQEQNKDAAVTDEFEADPAESSSEDDATPDIDIPNNSTVLPAFLTRTVEPKVTAQPVQEQGWEEQA